MEKNNDDYYRRNYKKWFGAMLLTVMCLLLAMLGMLFMLRNIPEEFKDNEDIFVNFCKIGAILFAFIWAFVLSRAMLAMEKINNDSRYLSVRKQFMKGEKVHLFTGEKVRTTRVMVPIIITYPVAVVVFSKSFQRIVKQDEKLQRKYKTEEKYHRARKKL